MWTGIEQQGATEMLNEPQVPAPVKKDPSGVSRLEHARMARTTALSPRPEAGHDSTSAVEWLSSSIVHDLRNPLGAIYSAAEMLIRLDSTTTQMRRLATNIFNAAGRMRELLVDLNNVARGNKATPEMCDIRDVIVSASNAASPETGNGRVQIAIEVPEGIELPLIRPRMQSVFFNLIANALEAMPAGGRLHIAGRRTASCVMVEMEDTGPGIPNEIRDKVFEPFVTAGKENGLGLGLALSRQAVLDHGGDIWIEPAAGARFVIRLPLKRLQSSQTFYVLAESSTSGDLSKW